MLRPDHAPGHAALGRALKAAGDPRYAHTRDEQVAIDALVRSYETLERFACG